MGAPPRLNPLSPGGTLRRAEFLANLTTKAKLCTKAYEPGGCTYPGCERYHDRDQHAEFLTTLKKRWCPGVWNIRRNGSYERRPPDSTCNRGIKCWFIHEPEEQHWFP